MTNKPPKTVAAIQSSYIPWKGYFDLIALADEFVLYDDVQYTRKDWRNRNRIKSPTGPLWLTIPVEVSGRFHQKINETRIADPRWGRRHWRSIAVNYARAPCFRTHGPWLEELLVGKETAGLRYLSEVNRRTLVAVCELLGITTPITPVEDFSLGSLGRVERIAAMCEAAGASRYVVGPSARSYMDARPFAQAGIALEYMDYEQYPAYPQVHPPFCHEVSIVDLILNTGPEAFRSMKFLARETPAVRLHEPDRIAASQS